MTLRYAEAQISEPSQICTVEGCGKEHVARGWCWAHYRRWWKHGDPQAGGVTKSRVKINVIDLLEIDGGWWTIDALELRLGAKPDSISQALNRLTKEGKTKKRERASNRVRSSKGIPEWKAV